MNFESGMRVRCVADQETWAHDVRRLAPIEVLTPRKGGVYRVAAVESKSWGLALALAELPGFDYRAVFFRPLEQGDEEIARLAAIAARPGEFAPAPDETPAPEDFPLLARGDGRPSSPGECEAFVRGASRHLPPQGEKRR